LETIHAFSSWLSGTAFSLFLQTTYLVIPVLQTIHIICLATVFSSSIVLALRLSGHGLTMEPLAHVASRLTGLMKRLVVILLATGLLLMIAEPDRTATNPAFYWKMAMLAAVLVITAWLASIARREGEKPSAIAMAASYVAVLLWVGIMAAGRLIAYTPSL